MHAVELATGRLEIALDARSDRDHDRVVVGMELLRVDVAPDLRVVLELHALLLEDLHAAVDHPLLELGVGHAKADQTARGLVALIDRDVVADLVELLGGGKAGGARADHGDGVAGAPFGRAGDDPALLEPAVDDRVLDLLDHHRVVVDGQHAGRLAWRRADEAGELREVVGRVQLFARVLPVTAADEVVPVGDQVAERTRRVAEGHAAVHAPSALEAQLVVGQDAEDLAVVAHPLGGIALGHRVPGESP